MMKAALFNRVLTRRFATTASQVQPKHPFSLKLDKQGFSKGFLGDPSVYPLIVILGTALTFMTGMGVHALTSFKDVQIDPVHRGEIIKTWGEDKHQLTHRWTRRSTQRLNMGEEGLGIDHKEWLKHKKDH